MKEKLHLLQDADRQVRELAVDMNQIPEHGFPLAGMIIKTRDEIERLWRVLPIEAFKDLLGVYLSLNQYAGSLRRAAATPQELDEMLRPALLSR